MTSDSPMRAPHDAIRDVRAWTAALFSAIDAKDTESFLRFVSDDGVFRFANFPSAVGTARIREAVSGFFASVAALKHEIADAWGVPGGVVCRGTVTYTRHDGAVVTLPFCNVFATSGERVRDYCVYIDHSPLFAPAAKG